MDDYKPDFFRLLAYIFRDATWWSILIGCAILLGAMVLILRAYKPKQTPEESTVLFAIALIAPLISLVIITQPVIFLAIAAMLATLAIFVVVALLIARMLGPA